MPKRTIPDVELSPSASSSQLGTPQENIYTALEEWLSAHLDWIVFALIAILFLYDLNRAARTYLQPDEALFYQLAHQRSISEAYAANNTNAHPPLLVLFLQWWITLNTSEIFLRMPALLAYCGFLWFFYRWTVLVLGSAAGLAAVVFAGFVPPVFNLAVEVRPYTIMLFAIACATWASERAFREYSSPHQSVKWTGIGTASLYLAILSHYSAVYFVSAFGVYCLVRICQGVLPAAAVRLWTAGQIVGITIYAVLYVTHISHLRNSALEHDARMGWLRAAYRLPNDDAIPYLIMNTRGLLEYQFGSLWAAAVGCILLIAGFVLLFRRTGSLLTLTLLPWIIYAATALKGFYPYGGSRHSVFLAFSLTIACSVTLAAVTHKKLWVLSALLLVLVPAWRATAIREIQVWSAERQSRELMLDAVNYVRASVPPRGLLFLDYESALIFCYYYDPNKFCFDKSAQHFRFYDLGAIRVISSQTWTFDPVRFTQELALFKRQYNVKPSTAIWNFQGWDFLLYRGIQEERQSPLPRLREFGRNIAVFQIPN